MRPRLLLVAAMDLARGIGRGNALPWHLPRDLRRFRSLTLGKPLIVGRRTYESVGKPLPGRYMIVVTRSVGYTAPGCEVAGSLDEALSLAAQWGEEAVIGGGETIYAAALPGCDRLALTLVLGHFPCDTFFPDLWSQGVWQVRADAFHPADDQNPYACVFLEVERVTSV
ncbi:MAG: dihydrofolate reductase [Myxococcales bacterium]|nr:dihydrofolate reductase [Polyangiaceae bacterium]MDW8249459.1 dihydrofolate reductase [Myxococcales bacterium]